MTASALPSHEPTALMCLARIARHHGVTLSVDRLIHDYALSSPLASKRLILRICKEAGLRAGQATLAWEDLAGLGQAFPCMARLSNGYWVILSGFKGDTPDGELVVLDPRAPQEGFLFLKRELFCRQWAGEVLFIKRSWSLADPDRPFGIGWFLALFLGQKRVVTDITLAALTLQFLGLATPVFFQLVIDKVLLHQSQATLYTLGIAVTGALLFDAAFGFLRRYLLLFASNRIDIEVATRTFAHLLRLPIDFFERGPAGVLVKHMQQAEKVRQFLTGRLFLTLLDTFALLVFLPVLALYSGTLTAVVLSFTLLIAAVIAGLIRPFQARLRQLYEAEGARQALLVETIHGMRTVKALALEPLQRRTWEGRTAQAVAMQYRVGKISITAQAVTGFLEKMMLVAVIMVGAQGVFDGTLTVGALIAFQMLAGRVSGPLVQIVSLIHEYQETALSVRMLGNVMNQRPERGGAVGGIRPPLKGSIEFENVTFRYTADGSPALDGVSFEIPAGRVIGVVGRSGSGKTTVTRLIQGLYTAQEGVVRMDGYDLREIDLAHLRSSIGVVLQDNFMFRGTVRENIAASRPDASLDDIVEVARLAGADEFIERLPRGYETVLEEDAANLSGGQKQRLAIARALIKRPRLLILDEATSALDPESEYLIQRNLHLIARGRTLIIVSHRLSTLAGADQILVLKGGRIAGIGTHEALLDECTPYAQLWEQQTRHLGARHLV